MTEPAPWHASFPAPRTSDPPALPRATLLQWLQQGTKAPGTDFLLVDLRRTDLEGGTIRGSLNLPAQSLYPTLSTLYSLVRAAGVKDVVFYCGMFQFLFSIVLPSLGSGLLLLVIADRNSILGSCGGRGTRAAGWFADHLADQGAESEVKSWKLEGGIKGWVNEGEEYTALMDGFDGAVWAK